MENFSSRPIIILQDRMPLSSLPEDVVIDLRRRALITLGDNPKASFVGIILLESIYVFVPRSIPIPTDYQLSLLLASQTIKTVTKYAREDKDSRSSEDDGDGRSGFDQLSLYINLLNDYRKNGIYTLRRSVSKINLGKTDWKKTINRINPLPGSNNQPIYMDTYGVKRQYFNNCEIASIHADCLRSIDKDFSWIISGSPRALSPELSDISPPVGGLSYKLARLKRELFNTYSDRDIWLLKQLILFYDIKSGTEKSNFTAGLQKFHFCWEHMLNKVLCHTINLNSQLPAPAYIDSSDNVVDANEKSMRTDIIMRKDTSTGREYIVADAKYYSATNVSNSPGWSDLVKQFFYAKALATIDKKPSTVKNVFIFPGSHAYFKAVRVKNRIQGKGDNMFTLGSEPSL